MILFFSQVLEEVGNEIPPEGYISPQFHIFRQHNTDSIMFILDTGIIYKGIVPYIEG